MFLADLASEAGAVGDLMVNDPSDGYFADVLVEMPARDAGDRFVSRVQSFDPTVMGEVTSVPSSAVADEQALDIRVWREAYGRPAGEFAAPDGDPMARELSALAHFG